jgi:tRNA threonylcarbamoyladenosine biosynthesis protein TsaB
LILFSSELEFTFENKIKMNKLIIDAANEKIFLMIITIDNIYNITHENTKINYEKLTIIITDFLNNQSLKIKDINKIYINRGPGSFAGIRNSLSLVKAFYIAKKIDYYCYSLQDFKDEENITYENIPNLCDKFKIKKNLINPIYIS